MQLWNKVNLRVTWKVIYAGNLLPFSRYDDNLHDLTFCTGYYHFDRWVRFVVVLSIPITSYNQLTYKVAFCVIFPSNGFFIYIFRVFPVRVKTKKQRKELLFHSVVVSKSSFVQTVYVIKMQK